MLLILQLARVLANHNGYNRDGKRGKLQIVIGLLADEEGEPLAVRVFEGNRSDPTTVGEQIQILQEQFGVEELVFVGDRGMVKSKGKQALTGRRCGTRSRGQRELARPRKWSRRPASR